MIVPLKTATTQEKDIFYSLGGRLTIERKLTRYFRTRKFCSGSLFFRESLINFSLASVGSCWKLITSSKRSKVRRGSGSSRKKAFKSTATRCTSVLSSKLGCSPELTFACIALTSETLAERRKIPRVSRCSGVDKNSTHCLTIGGMSQFSLFTDIQLSEAPNWHVGSGVEGGL